ncbi:type II secretion system F family protein [Nesterenkonia sp. MY13]|uniref:Type II secretion system F family protein n=1 Tax=Nesterenkonia sedimenti TaxID=1463632 RepID=A0A7X8YEZ5_9MICC|nr:type II secretion system F family protein [Nesterenkonia sedimenti]NLS11005.1 type II secretion system F family protein [Nesterenkonia sedimenti]
MSDALLVLTAALAAAAAVLILVPAEHKTAHLHRRVFGRIRSRRREQGGEEAEAPILLDLTAALLSAGVGIEAALDRLARTVPGAQPLAAAHRALAAGAPWEQATELVTDHQDLHSFCDHLSFAYATGAPSTGMLKAAAARARAERRAQAEAAAEKLGVKMMLPLGFCFLPAFILLGVVPVVASLIPETLGF